MIINMPFEKGCTLPPRPVTVNYAIIENGELEVEWTKPNVYDVQLGGYNIYGYVGNTQPTDFNQYSLITSVDSSKTSAEISMDSEYDYVLVASVSTDGVIQKDLSQSYQTTKISDTKTLSDYSWRDIEIITNYRTASDYFSVGDTKTFTADNISQTAMIYGFNHDTKEDDTIASVTFGLVSGCTKTTMSTTASNANGWNGSGMRSYLNNTYYNLLPLELRKVIKPVRKKASSGSSSPSILTSIDKLFLFSEIEVRGELSYSISGEGKQYEGFKDASNRIKCYRTGTSASTWWLRSAKNGMSTSYVVVEANGSFSYADANSAYMVVYGFCI